MAQKDVGEAHELLLHVFIGHVPERIRAVASISGDLEETSAGEPFR